MVPSIDDHNVVNEEIWRAWVQKGRLHDLASIRRIKILAGLAGMFVAAGGAYYLSLR